MWKLRTGSPWRDLPERYGPWQTCHARLVRWQRDGTWDRLLTHVQTKSDAVGEVEWEVSVDSTVIRVPRPGVGRPRTRPEHLIADKGYSYARCRAALRRRGIAHTIPERSDQREQRAHRPGRKPAFDRATYRRRNVVERCVNRLKQWRGIATRYEKRAANYRAIVVIASTVIWLAS